MALGRQALPVAAEQERAHLPVDGALRRVGAREDAQVPLEVVGDGRGVVGVGVVRAREAVV